MSVESHSLVEAFQDSIGTGRAEDVVGRACSECGLDETQQFSEDEALEVVETVTEFDDTGQFVRIAANTLKTRIRTGDL